MASQRREGHGRTALSEASCRQVHSFPIGVPIGDPEVSPREGRSNYGAVKDTLLPLRNLSLNCNGLGIFVCSYGRGVLMSFWSGGAPQRGAHFRIVGHRSAEASLAQLVRA